jgi:ElaB/YqjD/DUF883 family membrane-anchored ribosome-binding protein
MTNDQITRTRETLIKDTGTLKQDAGLVIEDVKKHASAHIDVVKQKTKNMFDTTCEYVKEHPFRLGAAALFVGFLVGAFRRK